MSMNLLEAVRSYFPPNIIDNISKDLNESSAGTGKALTAAVPTVLGAFVNRAESGDAKGLLNDARQAEESGILNKPRDLMVAKESGMKGISGLFGGGLGSIVSSLAGFSGIKSDSVQSILAMLTPIGLGVLGRHSKENNLSAQGLGSYLAEQKSSIMSALPAGLSLGSMVGAAKTNVGGTAERVMETGRDNLQRRKLKGIPWLVLIVAVAAIAVLWYFLSRGGKPESTIAAADTTKTMVATAVDTSAKKTAPVGVRSLVKVKLPDGTEINAYRGGVEDQLVMCLNDMNCKAGTDKWFDFDNINFETGSARLTAESMQQVNNIVTILKTYPKAIIKIGGYTDKTGNDAANKRLSQQRAEAVLIAIRKAGASTSQLFGAEGYGSTFAKADATAPDEERRKDRRISVQLREK